MWLSRRVRQRLHTVNRFRMAACQRWRESECLFEEGFLSGSIYLQRYVVESLLKAAFFQLVPPYDVGAEISLAVLKNELAHSIGEAKGTSKKGLDLHDLPLLLMALGQRRLAQGKPFDVEFEREAHRSIALLDRHRTVAMRYFALRPSMIDAAEARHATKWVIDRFRHF